VTESPFAAAQRLLVQAAEALIEVTESGSYVELVALLSTCENVVRRLDRATVNAVAVLERRGVFAERGYTSVSAALSDLLGWERFEARRRVVGRRAGDVTGRVGRGGPVGPVARHRRGVRCRGDVAAARRDHRPGARFGCRGAAVP
jgi:5-methylcytosine-specific restriction protein A